jgi:hypothetical protein
MKVAGELDILTADLAFVLAFLKFGTDVMAASEGETELPLFAVGAGLDVAEGFENVGQADVVLAVVRS